MQNEKLKNIVVLKNLPSNIIEEAIVILKTNKYAKKLQFIEKNIVSEHVENTNTEDYVIKEAENVIANYISKMEKTKLNKKSNKKIETKYKKIKAYSIFVSIILAFYIFRVMFQL